MVATEPLNPGQYIGFVEGETHNHNVDVCACEHAMSVGIVDPFLKSRVMTGQRFWMFLHPNTITSLRHNWTHPAFGNSEVPDTSDAEKWLRTFADECDLPYGVMIEAAKDRIKTGDSYTQYGGESAQEAMYNSDNRAKFWRNIEIVTGLTAPDHEDQPFSCSC